VGLEVEVLEVTREGFVRAADFPTVMREIVELKHRLSERGITEVLVFYQGPVTFATILGAVLDNWVPAKIYAFRNGRYELDFVLSKETVIAP